MEEIGMCIVVIYLEVRSFDNLSKREKNIGSCVLFYFYTNMNQRNK